MEEDIKILECENVGDLASIGLIDLLNEENNYDLNKLKKQALENLIKRYQLLEHRLEVADEFVQIIIMFGYHILFSDFNKFVSNL